MNGLADKIADRAYYPTAKVGTEDFIMDAWKDFVRGDYEKRIDVRNFIQKNYTPYEGDDSFLAKATPRTDALMKKVNDLLRR